MGSRASKRFTTLRVVLIGIMAAMAFISNLIRIPLGDSKISVGNAVCLLNGLLFGPLAGFLSSGIGNMLYDLMTGYGAECLITFVSKGAIAVVCGIIAGSVINHDGISRKDMIRIIVSCILGAFVYVFLYMLKTFIFGLTINGLTMEATKIKMLSKLPASLINAAFASVAVPLLYPVLHPALRKAGLGR